jgi:large subunit ribosomal protein L18
MKHITFDRVLRRKRRVSSNIFGTGARPRICIYRSNKYIYAQAVDDEAKKTVASFSSYHIVKASKTKAKKAEVAKQVGVELAKKLKDKKITKGVFDRSIYAYLGRVKSLAEGLREGGLQI